MTFGRFCLLALLLWPALAPADPVYTPARITAPEPVREFRGAWLATVANIDWPSRPGLPVARQKAELMALLDRAVRLHLNAIIFQVRPSADALYVSSLEPWSEYLMGHMGQAPVPAYDPLAFAVAEAHRRGLELHAWFNPFRARHAFAKSPPSATHFSRTHPELVRQYGGELDLDPGEPAVRAYVQRVVLDVVNRYDVDGVQFDDYFYPYPVKDALQREVDFPDLATWQRYGAPFHLDRANWRRQNINVFVQNMHAAIQAAKPWVQFGISPFGIWRPYNPPSVRGFDAYSKLYADSRLWLASGWVDYLSPQLYWPVAAPQQSFPALLQWWQAQNIWHRHIWPGLADYRTGQLFGPGEIARQIAITRETGAPGTIHFHLRNLMTNNALTESLRSEYAEPALPPVSPWLDAGAPGKPVLHVVPLPNGTHMAWWPGSVNGAGGNAVRNWVVQALFKTGWQTEILPAPQTSCDFPGRQPEAVVVRAADRLGNLSEPAGAVRAKPVIQPSAGHRGS
jgi:uncharacterized lipoprotein YddW (UPF0748 family)